MKGFGRTEMYEGKKIFVGEKKYKVFWFLSTPGNKSKQNVNTKIKAQHFMLVGLSLAYQDDFSTKFVFLRVVLIVVNQAINIYITIRAVCTKVIVKNGEIPYYKYIGSESQPLQTFSIKSTNIKGINGNKLGNWNQENKGFGRTELMLGRKMWVEESRKKCQAKLTES